jgi:hypothetical protein
MLSDLYISSFYENLLGYSESPKKDYTNANSSMSLIFSLAGKKLA